MAKKKSERLKTVLWLAELKQKKAAEELARAINEAEAQQQQAEQLLEFQQEYCNQFRANADTTDAVSSRQLQNIQRFYSNLDSAIETQQQHVELLNGQQQMLREQWSQLYARQKNVSAMVEKAEATESQRQEAKLQRELDDRYASRSED